MAFGKNTSHRWRQWRLGRYAPVVSAALLLPGIAAATPPTTTACGVINTLNRIAQTFSYTIGLLAVLIILYAALLFLMGSGNEETLKKAKNFLVFGLIGLGVAMLAFSAVPIAGNLFPGGIVASCPT